MTANLESFNTAPTDATSTPSTLMQEVHQERTQSSTVGSKISDLANSAENKVKDLFGSLQIVDSSAASSQSDVAKAAVSGGDSSQTSAADAQKTGADSGSAAKNAGDSGSASKVAGDSGSAPKVAGDSNAPKAGGDSGSAPRAGTDNSQPSSQDAAAEALKTAQENNSTATRPIGEGARPLSDADAQKAASDIEDGLHWYKSDEYGKIDGVLKGHTPDEIKQIDEAFKKTHDGKGIEETLDKRWSGHQDELSTAKELLHPKDQTPPAKPEATAEQVKEQQDKAIESMKKDPDVQAKHDEIANKAKETMHEPELGKFLGNMDKLEEREAKMSLNYEKENEAKGMNPEQAAKEAEKKAHDQVKDTYTNVEKLIEHNPAAKLNEKDRLELAQQVMKHAGDPTSISQGNYATCTLAVLESRTFSRDPAEASRMISEVATTGQYTRPGKEPIKVDAESLKKHGDAKEKEPDEKLNQRDFASQLFEVTAANVGLEQRNNQTNPPGQLRYEQHEAGADKVHNPEDNGERLMDYSTHPPKVVANTISLTPGEVAHASKEISPTGSEGPVMVTGSDIAQLGKKVLEAYQINGNKPIDTSDPNWVQKAHESVANKGDLSQKDKDYLNKTIDDTDKQIKEDQTGSVLHVHNAQEMKDSLAQLQKDGKLPVIVAVDTNNEPFWSDSRGGDAGGAGGQHVVTIKDYNPATGTATIENQWDGKADHEISAEKLFLATQDKKEVIASEKNEVKSAQDAGHRDYVKEYDLLRMEKTDKMDPEKFKQEFVQETLDRVKDLKENKISQTEFDQATKECVLMLKKMKDSPKSEDQKMAQDIEAQIRAGMKAA